MLHPSHAPPSPSQQPTKPPTSRSVLLHTGIGPPSSLSLSTAVSNSSTGPTASSNSTATSPSSQNNNNSRSYHISSGFSLSTPNPTPVPAILPHPSGRVLYTAAGCDVLVWDLVSFSLLDTLSGHKRPVACLTWHKGVLVSGSCDRTARLWKVSLSNSAVSGFSESSTSSSTTPSNSSISPSISSINSSGSVPVHSAKHLGTLTGFLGDLLSVASVASKYLLFGLQDTSIVLVDSSLNAVSAIYNPPLRSGVDGNGPVSLNVTAVQRSFFHHAGLVYALTTAAHRLFSGSGDGTVGVWDLESSTNDAVIAELKGHRAGVTALVVDETVGNLYSGSQDKTVRVWDLASLQCKGTLSLHSGAVLALAVSPACLYSVSADGTMGVWDTETMSPSGTITVTSDPESVVLSLVCLLDGDAPPRIFTGDSNGTVRGYVESPPTPISVNGVDGRGGDSGESALSPKSPNPARLLGLASSQDDLMLATLAEFIGLRSVSTDPTAAESCWSAARWLCNLYETLGAEVSLEAPLEGRAPVVAAKFGSDPSKKTIVVYAHYDVVAAKAREWDSDPFVMDARDGYLYGRGVSDDKGPLIAITWAVKSLIDTSGGLPVNVVFLVEGEEENGGAGLKEAVGALKEWIGSPEVLLVSNTHWMTDSRPCLTWGTRGIINMSVTVSGPGQDLHSGQDGGAVREPMMDLIALIGSLTAPDGSVVIPGFSDAVAEYGAQEKSIMTAAGSEWSLSDYTTSLGLGKGSLSGSAEEVLAARWRKPSLTVHSMEGSYRGRGGVIPKNAVGRFSVRTVPNQSNAEIAAMIQASLEATWKTRQASGAATGNSLKIEIESSGDWWLGDLEGDAFKQLSTAVTDVWGQEPLFVREGGSLPIAWLGPELGAESVHLPMGQASDQAHLQNERMRLVNLLRGREVVKRFFEGK